MPINFPNNPTLQVPSNEFSPTSSPLSTQNGVTYTWDGEKWVASSVVLSGEYVKITGDTMTGNLTLGDYDGSSADKGGAILTKAGLLEIQRADKNATKALKIIGQGDQVAAISSDGSASLANERWTVNTTGQVEATAFIGDNISGQAVFAGKLSGSKTYEVTADATVRIGGTIPSATNITLQGWNGKGIFLGDLDVGGNNGNASNGVGNYMKADTGGMFVYVNGPSRPIFRGYNSTEVTFEAKGEGSLYIGGDLTNLPDGNPTSPNISLNADGSAAFAGTATFGATSSEITNTSSTETGSLISAGGTQWQVYDLADGSNATNLYNLRSGTKTLVQATKATGALFIGGDVAGGNPNTLLASDGSADFAGKIEAQGRLISAPADGSSSSKLDPGGMISSVRPTGTSVGTLIFHGGTNDNDTTRFNIRMFAGGGAEFQGDLAFPNALLRLEADDDTKYTSTTDVDGNETRVYNGATLDMKEVGLALVALKAAAANATDFASLKSAIATSLANL